MHNTVFRTRSAAAGLAVALIAGGVLLGASPATAAGTCETTNSAFYALATTHVSGGTAGRAYARHGAQSALSAWSTESQTAWASGGFDGSGGVAYCQFS